MTCISFQLFKRMQDRKLQIITSLFMISCSYVLCEKLECSGATACVICGVCFSALRDREEKRGRFDLTEFDSFWEILDMLLNSVLYVILGISFQSCWKLWVVCLIRGESSEV